MNLSASTSASACGSQSPVFGSSAGTAISFESPSCSSSPGLFPKNTSVASPNTERKQRFQIFHQSFGKPATQQKRINRSLRRVFSFSTIMFPRLMITFQLQSFPYSLMSRTPTPRLLEKFVGIPVYQAMPTNAHPHTVEP